MEETDIHMKDPRKTEPTPLISKEAKPSGSDALQVSRQGTGHHPLIVNTKGTGPNKVAYVQDLDYDRSHAAFRTVDIDGTTNSEAMAAQAQQQTLEACLQLESGTNPRWTKQSECLEPDRQQIVFNTASFPRMWCGKEIGPGVLLTLEEHCDDPIVYLFGKDSPSVDGKGMQSMILLTSAKDTSTFDSSTLQQVECDIPCEAQPAPAITEALLQRSFAYEPWKIKQTLGAPGINYNAYVERTDYRRDTFYSTPSFKSDVPLSLYNPELFSLRNRPAVSYDEALPKGVYMVNTHCTASPKRVKYVHSLLDKGFPVESMGQCDHNAEVPRGMSIETSEGRIEVMKKFRFVLAFDHVSDKDYVSTTIWEALVAGAVPVVFGAENARVHLPKNSFIDSGFYGGTGWDKLSDALIEINNSKEQWESYHAWRTDEAELAKVEAMYEFTKTDETCRLCRWGYSKKYGLGWDHVTQRVKETRLSRTLCTTETNGLASKPFQEGWISRSEEAKEIIVEQEEGGTEKCSVSAVSNIDIESTYKVDRSLFEHDGVTDLIVNKIERESMENDLVLRLNFVGVQNSEGASFLHAHTTVKDLTYGSIVSSISMQDQFSKVTILADWVTSIKSPREGVVEIVVVARDENREETTDPLTPNIPRRIRVIVEDMDVINDKMTEYFPSPFAKRMIKDFVDPLELYYAKDERQLF